MFTVWYHHTKPTLSDLRVVYSVVSPYKTHPVRPTCCLQCGIAIQNPPSQTYVFTVWYHHTKPTLSDLRVVYSVVSPYKTHPVRPTCLQCGVTIQNPPCQTYVFTVWCHHTKPTLSDLRVYSVVSPYKTHPVRPTCCLQCGITIQNPPCQTYVFTVWYHHTKPTLSDLRVYSVVSPYKTHPVRPTCCLQCGITIQNPPSQTYVCTVFVVYRVTSQTLMLVFCRFRTHLAGDSEAAWAGEWEEPAGRPVPPVSDQQNAEPRPHQPARPRHHLPGETIPPVIFTTQSRAVFSPFVHFQCFEILSVVSRKLRKVVFPISFTVLKVRLALVAYH